MIGCVPALGLFGFVWPSGAEISVAILAFGGLWLLLRNEASCPRAPLVLAGIWILYFVFSASYATLLELPGQHWKSFGKHIPVAIGPFIAIALFAARDRLGIRTDTIVALFLTGVVIGATVVLIRNGAPKLFENGWPEFASSHLGNVNRNYAALASGLSVLCSASLIQFLCTVKGVRSIWTAGAVAGLTLLLLFTAALLIVLRGRTGYAATTTGLAVWFTVLMGSALVRRRTVSKRAWAIPLIILTTMTAIAVASVSVLGDRLAVKGSSITNLQIIGQLLRGGQPSADLTTGEDRLQLAKVAIDLIRERPWFGWGPDVWHLIGLHSPWPEIRQFNQFHNGYLQTVVSYGAVGAVLLTMLVIAVLRAGWRARQTNAPSDRLSPPLFAAALALTAFLAVFNLTETVLLVKPAAIVASFLVALACLAPAPRSEAAVPI